MTFPHLGSLLLSVALAAPRLLGEDERSPEPAPSEEKPAVSVTATAAAEASPQASNPPPLLVPNRSLASGTKQGGSKTRPTDSSQASPLRASPPASVVSSALRESFHYDAALHAQNADSESSDSAAVAGAAGSDVVMLPKMTVNERPLPRDLGADIARWRSKAPQNHSRFGTGVHEKDFGKVRVSTMTLFYIPIGFGLRW